MESSKEFFKRLELMDKKRCFVKNLEMVIKEADENVETLSLSDDGRYLYIHYPLAKIIRLYIAFEDYSGIIQDVLDAIA